MAPHDRGAHTAPAHRRGGLLWLWLLLAAIALTLAAWALAQLLDDGDEVPPLQPAPTSTGARE